jgi:hypothetical protein
MTAHGATLPLEVDPLIAEAEQRGVMIAVQSFAGTAPEVNPSLRVTRADFGGFEGARLPFAQRSVRSDGRVLDAYVEVASVTPATVVAANAALAG